MRLSRILSPRRLKEILTWEIIIYTGNYYVSCLPGDLLPDFPIHDAIYIHMCMCMCAYACVCVCVHVGVWVSGMLERSAVP